MLRILRVVAALTVLALPLPATTFTVTSAADAGAGSLREAIAAANAAAGADTIAFNIVGSGVHTIVLVTELPDITSPVTIDGYTQPGSSANTNDTTQGLNTVLRIEIDGTALPANTVHCLDVAAADTTIRGLVINRCGGSGIRLQSTANNAVIEGNFIGTNPAGTGSYTGVPNDLILGNSPDNVRIGGTTPAARNLLSGGDTKITMGLGAGAGPDGLLIQGNLIGMDVTGTLALPNGGAGLDIGDATNTTIGGASAAARNVISGNDGSGVYLHGGDTALVAGNFIGVDITGTQALGNGQSGVHIEMTHVTLGGSAPGAGNVISSNSDIGVVLGQSAASTFATVHGNFIGTDVTGTLNLGNNDRGIHAGGADSVIGGIGPGEGNVIANTTGGGQFETGVGVYVPAFPRVTIRGNRIFGNFGVGIDNMAGGSPDGATPNDPGDTDTGGNLQQNFPVLGSIESSVAESPQGASTRIQGVLHSAASTTYALDFYASPACSKFPREFVQGQDYIGSGQVTTDGSGAGVFDVTLQVATEPGARISATATDPAGNTSEFSQRLPFSSSPKSGPPAGGTAITILGTDFGSGASVLVGGQPATNVVVVNDKRITAVTPALAPGLANDIVVSNTDGTTGRLAKGFVSNFTDVPNANLFYSFVTTLVSNAITSGIGGGLYGVDQPTLRQQMAVFLLKSKLGLCYTPPTCGAATFTDVPCSNPFAAWIYDLVARNITAGCGGGKFCPTSPVNRQQMAAFLLKTLEGGSYTPPACTTATFTDVPCSNPFAAWIYELVARSITAGCGGGNYCPATSASRGQMATFLVKTFGLP